MTPRDDRIEITARLIDQALTEGLTVDQATWARASYRSQVLPSQLNVELPDALETGWCEMVAKAVVERLGTIDPDERWRTVVIDVCFARFIPLSNRAFDLALTALAAGSGTGVLALAAAEVRDQLDELERELVSIGEVAHAALIEDLAEARLDCEYVLRGGTVVSRRLGATQDAIAAEA